MTEYDESFEQERLGGMATASMKYFIWRNLLNRHGFPKFECAAEIGDDRPRPCRRPCNVWIGNLEGVESPEEVLNKDTEQQRFHTALRHPSKADGLQFAIPLCARHSKEMSIERSCIVIRRTFSEVDLLDQLWELAQIEDVRLGPLAGDLLLGHISFLKRANR